MHSNSIGRCQYISTYLTTYYWTNLKSEAIITAWFKSKKDADWNLAYFHTDVKSISFTVCIPNTLFIPSNNNSLFPFHFSLDKIHYNDFITIHFNLDSVWDRAGTTVGAAAASLGPLAGWPRRPVHSAPDPPRCHQQHHCHRFEIVYEIHCSTATGEIRWVKGEFHTSNSHRSPAFPSVWEFDRQVQWKR